MSFTPPLRRFSATSAALTQSGRPSSNLSRRLRRYPTSTSLELPGPTAFADAKALFCAPLSGSVREALPSFSEVPHTGFGYPLCGVSTSHPRKHLSAPNTHGLRPSKLFSSPAIDQLFRTDLSAPAFSYKTLSGLVSTLQRLAPAEEAVLLIATRRVNSGRSRVLSWALRPLGRSPLLNPGISIFLIPVPSRS
jgi:hypothetical protein